jgi:hypothetical protein
MKQEDSNSISQGPSIDVETLVTLYQALRNKVAELYLANIELESLLAIERSKASGTDENTPES